MSSSEAAELIAHAAALRERIEGDEGKGKGKGKTSELLRMYPGITPESIELCRSMHMAEMMGARLVQQAADIHAAENTAQSASTLITLRLKHRGMQQTSRDIHESLADQALADVAQ